MVISRKMRKRVLIVGGCILTLIIANLILSSIIESKITELLSNNESDYYDISVGTDWEYCKKLSSIGTKMSDCT